MSKRNFNYVEYGEPHAKRRKTLLQKHPEIKQLMGYDPKQAIPVFIIVPLQLFFAACFYHNYNPEHSLLYWGTMFLFSYFIGSILMHWLAMAIHETSHYAVFKEKWQNRYLAIFANISIPFPMAMTFHKYHPRHHTFLGVDDIDADLPQDFEVNLIGKSRPRKFFWWLFNPIFYLVRGVLNATATNRWEMINVIFIGIVNLFIFYAWGWTGISYLLLSTYFGMGPHPVAAHFIHEHYLFDGVQETYSYYGPLNKVSYNVGYHNEHHDFMNIPGSKLPALKNILEEEYQSLTSHQSWTNVLWQFIMRKDMGLSSRLVRTRSDFFKDMKNYIRQKTYRELYK